MCVYSCTVMCTLCVVTYGSVYIYMVVWNGFVEMEIVFQNQYIYSCSLSFDREFFLIYRKNIHLKIEKICICSP